MDRIDLFRIFTRVNDAASFTRAADLLGLPRSSVSAAIAELEGRVGERNVYALHPRCRILLVPQTETGLYRQLTAALATGNNVVIDEVSGLRPGLKDLPASVAARVVWSKDWQADAPFAGALVEGDSARIVEVNQKIAGLPGPLVLTQAASSEELANNAEAYCLNWLLEEVSTSVNTTAAGGNASLMAIG